MPTSPEYSQGKSSEKKQQQKSRRITTNQMLNNNISALKRGFKNLKLLSTSIPASILFLVREVQGSIKTQIYKLFAGTVPRLYETM